MDFNLLLNIDFVTGSYIEFIKNLSFYMVIATVIIILLFLIYSVLDKNTDMTITEILAILLFIIGAIYFIGLIILILSIFIYPIVYCSAFIKDFVITGYELFNLNVVQEVSLNILIVFCCSFLYLYILKKLLENC